MFASLSLIAVSINGATAANAAGARMTQNSTGGDKCGMECRIGEDCFTMEANGCTACTAVYPAKGTCYRPPTSGGDKCGMECRIGEDCFTMEANGCTACTAV